MTKFRKYSALALAMLLTVLTLLSASAAEIKVDKSVCVIDNANVLDWETEAYVTQVTTALDAACGAQIGVYTVDYIGNTTMEDYCYQVASAWGMGDKDKDNGVVLLLAIKEDDYYVTRGTGLESELSVATLKRILDRDLEPNWVEGDFDTGTRETVLSIARVVASIYGVQFTLDGETYGGSTEYQEEKAPWTIESTLGVFVFLLMILPILIPLIGFMGSAFGVVWAVFDIILEGFGFGRRRGGGYGGGYHGPSHHHYGGYSSGSSWGSSRSGGSSWSSSGSRSSGSSWSSSGSRSSGSSFRSSGSSRSSGGGFRGSGGGSFRGGGAGRH